jgi:tetratricopeptide (TPR) repeat protein
MRDPTFPERTFPDDVREAIGRRVELLADDTQRLLAAASVLGRDFDVGVLATATKLDVDVVTAGLQEAVAAEVVVAGGSGRYTFAHALVENACYDRLSPVRRARLHRAAAEAFEQRGDDAPVAAIAYHYCCALPWADRARAVDYAWRAGAEAAARGASDQAVVHLERALEAARGGDDPEVLDPIQLTYLLCDLGDAYEQAGRPDPAQRAYAEAVDLAGATDEPIGLARAVLGLMGGVDESVGFNLTGVDSVLVTTLDDIRRRLPKHAPALRALVTARVAGARYDLGDVERAQTLSAEALDLARGCGDGHAVAVALAVRHTALSDPEALGDRFLLDAQLRTLGRAYSVQAEVWRVGDLLECGLLRYADDAMAGMAQGSLARSRRAAYYVALYRALRAQIDGRIEDAARACETARALGDEAGVRTAGVSYAVQSLFVARERRALDGLAELLDILADEHPHQPGFLTTAAWVRVRTGKYEAARRQFEALGADGFQSIPRNGVWLSNMRLLCEIAHALRAEDHAARLYELLTPYADRYIVVSRVLSFLGSVEHSLGLLALTTGNRDAAEAHLTEARARHDALGAPLLTARTDLAVAELRQARGDEAGARALRAAVRDDALAHGWQDLAAEAL